MSRVEFLQTLDDVLELPPGTLTSSVALGDIETWDSLAVVSFIASVNAFFGVTLEAKKVKAAVQVSDLLDLVSSHLSD